MTALVTGANGFVGSAVVRALLADGQCVRALVRVGSDRRNLDGLSVEIAEGDIRQPETLRPAMHGCTVVFHVAADYRLWVPSQNAMLETNVQGSVNVLRQAADAGLERMVYTSSVAVLGTRADGSPANETTPVGLADMIGPYKRSKYLAEQVVSARAQQLGFDMVTVNPSTPIGPGDIKPTPTGQIIVDAASGRMPAYVDTGLNVVHVDDVAAGHVLAWRNGRSGQRYILGGKDMTLKEILKVIARLRGRRAPLIRLPYWSVFPLAMGSEGMAWLTKRAPRITVDSVRMARKRMYFSSDKAIAELGYRAGHPEDALADSVAWFDDQGYL